MNICISYSTSIHLDTSLGMEKNGMVGIPKHIARLWVRRVGPCLQTDFTMVTGVNDKFALTQRMTVWHDLPSNITINTCEFMFIYITGALIYWVDCSPMVRKSEVQSPKMVHDAALLNIRYYKVKIKGKLEQSRE